MPNIVQNYNETTNDPEYPLTYEEAILDPDGNPIKGYVKEAVVAPQYDPTKWTEKTISEEIDGLNQNLTDLDFGSETDITPTAQGATWTAPSMGYVSGFFRKNSNSTNASLINISSNKLNGKSKYIATLPQISGAYMPIDMFVVRGETLTFASLMDINLATGQSRLFFNPIIKRT